MTRIFTAMWSAVFIFGQATPASCAMITSLSGDVQIYRPSAAAIPARLLDALFHGDTLRCGPDGKATVLYSSGRIVAVSPATVAAIESPPDGSRGDAPDETAGSAGRAGRVFALLAESERATANLTVRGPEDTLALLVYEPGNTSLLDSMPRIVWGLYPGARTYQVKVQRQGQDVLNIISVDTAAAYPEGRAGLAPGRYLMRITACGPAGETLSVVDRVFSVMHSGPADSVRLALAAVRDQKPDPFTGHLLAALIYGERNLRLNAIAEYRTILAEHPDLPLAHRSLSDLYRELGLPGQGNRHLDRYEELTGTE